MTSAFNPPNKQAFESLRDSPALDTLAPEHLEFLAEHAWIKSFEPGERIIEQGRPACACFLLLSGKVDMSFWPSDGESGQRSEEPPFEKLRQFDDPGRLLGWSALLEPFRYRATITALERTRVMVLEREVLDAYTTRHPDFGVALLERIIWVLGNRLRETRIRLVARRYDKEVTTIQALLDQNAELLQVNSPLHKLPYYLGNRLTLADAFQALELVKVDGDTHERDVAVHSLEILQQVRKELELYQHLQRVYEVVASAPSDARAEDVRRHCCEEFIELFDRLDYVIQGEENLPDSPGHIFTMNHLYNHPDNTLPNRFQLTLDTHFVSSMLLLKKYGKAPVRVIRKSRPDEYGHQKYYDRLGYIYVHSDHVDESTTKIHITPEERRQIFLDSACDYLLAGENIVICPEGTSVATENSPVAFKAGAFRLAAYVEPEPLIVPVAVANFDKNITRTRMTAVVHKPFRLSEFVPRPVEDGTLFDFIAQYQRKFAGFVAEAVALSG